MGAYATSYVTPSGLPVERQTRQENPTHGWVDCPASRASPATVSCSFDLRLPASGLPAGGYAVRIEPWLPPPASPGVEEHPSPDSLTRAGRTYNLVNGRPLTVIARGMSDPMSLATLLLVDAPAQAARGMQAQGDAEVWGWNNRIAWQPELHVTPRTDATGEAISYILEPYLPQILLADRDLPQPPLVDLDLPGGTWSVTVRDPDGGETSLGPSRFEQIVTRTATAADGGILNGGGGNVNAVARLATLDEAFQYTFAVDGLHSIEIEGEVDDAHGNRYRIGGTYEILVAEPMDLDLGTLPGTPLVVGEPINRAVQVHPPVPAEITYRLRAWTGPDAELTYDTSTHGVASQFGWFHDHPEHHPSTRIDEPGEYRVDVTARYTDSSGKQYAASWTMGGVIVDPDDALAVRGRRGIDIMVQDLARFRRDETGIETGGNHFNFPYHPGDVAWQTDDDSMEVRVTFDDPQGVAGLLLDGRADTVMEGVDEFMDDPELPWMPMSDHIRARIRSGQAPLFSTTSTGRDAAFGDPLDVQAYFYGTVERPGVRVREFVTEDYMPNAYWRFGDTYTLQPNMGFLGDLPNDYKFLFAGGVVRSPAEGIFNTGGYGAFWVHLPEGSPQSIVDSPFNPEAPPLIEFDGQEIRAFFEPTGIRPGTLLVEGDPADFGGYVVPLGPHGVDYRITSPSGETHEVSTRANQWGHLHATRLNFTVEEAGLWHVEVAVEACPLSHDVDQGWPCLTGGLNDGETSFVFYVASKETAPVTVLAPSFLVPHAPLELFTEGVGPGGHATAWMPGWTLESRLLEAGDPVIRYHHAELQGRFPNFEYDGLRDGIPTKQVTFTALVPTADGKWAGVALDVWGGRVFSMR